MANSTLRVIDATDNVLLDLRDELEPWLQARADAHSEGNANGVIVKVEHNIDPSSDWATIQFVVTTGVIIK